MVSKINDTWITTTVNKLNNIEYVIGNTDLDGVFSTSLLCNFFPNLKLGGFSNSANRIWLNKNVNKQNVAYIDIFIANKEILSIDNHIVQLDNNIVVNENKINPNLIRGVGLYSYYKKYPFSTFIFILKMIEKTKGSVNIDIDRIIGYIDNEPVFLWEVLLRADDTLLTTYKYFNNAKQWWEWLLNDVTKNSLLSKLYCKVQTVSTQENAMKIKNKVNDFLSLNFGCSNDGYKYINNNKFADFVAFFSEIMGCKLSFNNEHLMEIALFAKRVKIADNINEINTLLSNTSIKTFAFVKKDELSYSYI
jgi:hypothetical protein